MKRTLPVIALLALFAHCAVFAQTADPRGIKVVYGEARTALVIGNGAYAASPLINPPNDAEDVAALLEKRRFSVIRLQNATQAQMEEAIRQFGGKLAAGGVGVFYYSGHAVQVAGRNYLLPVGAEIRSETDLKNRAVDAGLVLEQMDNSRNRLNVVILDACRDNPYASSFRTAGQGLGRMDAPAGTLIAYATGPGKTASDGTGRNGLYTKHLLANAAMPGKELFDIMRDITGAVETESKGQQLPWMHASVRGKFYFTPYGIAEEELTGRQEEIRHLRELQAEQDKAAANLKKLEDEKIAEMAKLDAEIARLRAAAQQPGQSGGSLGQIVELGRKRKAAADELAAAQRKAESERQKREAEIVRVKAEALAKRKAEFEAAYKQYAEVVQFVEQGHLGAAEHQAAWHAICGQFGVKTPGDKPASLAWNAADGTVQLASLRVYGLGGTASTPVRVGQDPLR